MSDFRRIGSGPLPLPATHGSIIGVAGRGSGPVPRKDEALYTVSGVISMAPQGHSAAQMPQPLQ